MKTYLVDARFDTLMDKHIFNRKDLNSKWGAYDGIVGNKLLNYLQSEKTPFFSTWLTLTSHEPYETPVPVAIPGTDDLSLFLNSLHYTDQVVSNFIDQCANQPFWENTLCVIVADHGHRLPLGPDKEQDFRIPLLLTGGALRQQGVVIDKTVSQIDIAPTLLQSAGLPTAAYSWSKHLFNDGPGWAYFAFNNGFGMVADSSYVVFDNVGKQIITAGGAQQAELIRLGKSFIQASYQDYLNK